MTLGRLLNVYPLSFLLNLRRRRKISYKFQHMMVFAGLRGAVAFALAMRNTESVPRQMMLTSVLFVVLVTVILNGGATVLVLTILKIRVGVDPEEEERRSTNVSTHHESAWIFRKWYEIDVKFMKPLFTHRGQPLTETLPEWCGPFARFLSRSRPETTPETVATDRDEDMLNINVTVVRPESGVQNSGEPPDQMTGDLGLGAIEMTTRK